MAPDRAAAWACSCRWSGGGGDRGRPQHQATMDQHRLRCVARRVSCLRVGCRQHPSPRLGDTSPAVRRAMSGLPSGSQVQSSGPRREQSTCSSRDNGLQRRACRPAPGCPSWWQVAAYELAILAVPVSAVATVGPMVHELNEVFELSPLDSPTPWSPPTRCIPNVGTPIGWSPKGTPPTCSSPRPTSPRCTTSCDTCRGQTSPTQDDTATAAGSSSAASRSPPSLAWTPHATQALRITRRVAVFRAMMCDLQ